MFYAGSAIWPEGRGNISGTCFTKDDLPGYDGNVIISRTTVGQIAFDKREK